MCNLGLCLCVCSVTLSCPTFATLKTVTSQVPLSTTFSSQEYWTRGHFLLQGIFLTQGSSLHILHLLHGRQILYHCTKLGLDYSTFGSTVIAVVDTEKDTFRLKLLNSTSSHQDIILSERESWVKYWGKDCWTAKIFLNFLDREWTFTLYFNFAGNLIMLPILFKFGLFLQVIYLCYVVTWSSPHGSPVIRVEVNNSVVGDYLTRHTV